MRRLCYKNSQTIIPNIFEHFVPFDFIKTGIMKQHVFCFLGIFLIVSMSLAAQDSSEVQTEQFSESVVITIEGMACQEGCADTIQANLEKLSGVIAAEVSFANEKANVDFDS